MLAVDPVWVGLVCDCFHDLASLRGASTDVLHGGRVQACIQALLLLVFDLSQGASLALIERRVLVIPALHLLGGCRVRDAWLALAGRCLGDQSVVRDRRSPPCRAFSTGMLSDAALTLLCKSGFHIARRQSRYRVIMLRVRPGRRLASCLVKHSEELFTTS